MRILFLSDIVDPGVGSSVRQTFGMAREFKARGHDVAVVGTTRDPRDATPTAVEGIPVFRIYSDYPARFRAWVSLRNKRTEAPFASILDEWRPDIVHAHLVHAHLGYHALTQARAFGAGVVYTAHDAMTFCYQKLTCFHGGESVGGTLDDVVARASKCIPCQRLRFRPGRNRRIREVLSRDVHRVTTVSHELQRIMEANDLPVHQTVHNALETQGSDVPAAEVAAFRQRHGLEGKQVIAIGGRLHEQKGVGKLLEMLARLTGEFPQVRLIVMGEREIYDAEFLPRARKLGVDGHVVPTGWLDADELRAAYATIDVFVTPSLCFDTFGIVNLEAMEQSKPVVATSFGGSREVIEDGVTGYIANPFDVELYAGRIGELLRDPEKAAAMGRMGRARLLERFTLERLCDEFLEEYEAALAAR